MSIRLRFKLKYRLISLFFAFALTQTSQGIVTAIDQKIEDALHQGKSHEKSKIKSFYVPYEKIANKEFVHVNGHVLFFELGTRVTKLSQNEQLRNIVDVSATFASVFAVWKLDFLFRGLFDEKKTGYFGASLGINLFARVLMGGLTWVKDKYIWPGANSPYYTLHKGSFYHLRPKKPTAESLILEQALRKFPYLEKSSFEALLKDGRIRHIQPIFPKISMERRMGEGFKELGAFTLSLGIDTAFFTFGMPMLVGSSALLAVGAQIGYDRISDAIGRLYYTFLNKHASKYKREEIAPKTKDNVRISFVKGRYCYVFETPREHQVEEKENIDVK